MSEFIKSIDIWKMLIVYLLVLHVGSYSQLYFKNKPLLRNYRGDLSKVAYVLYWAATIIAILLTFLLAVIVVWKVVLWLS
jgi:hypothetical protein